MYILPHVTKIKKKLNKNNNISVNVMSTSVSTSVSTLLSVGAHKSAPCLDTVSECPPSSRSSLPRPLGRQRPEQWSPQQRTGNKYRRYYRLQTLLRTSVDRTWARPLFIYLQAVSPHKHLRYKGTPPINTFYLLRGNVFTLSRKICMRRKIERDQ